MRGEERSRLLLALTLGVASALFLAAFASVRSSPRSPDAIEYRAFADALLSGDLFVARPLPEMPRALVTRTPGYPLLLAAADVVVPTTLRPERVLHQAVGLAGLLYVTVALRAACPAWLTAAIVLVVQWQMRRYFALPLTEWACFNGLLGLFASAARAVDAPSYRRMAGVGLLCAFLILTRPALIVLAWVPLALAGLQRELPRVRAAAAAVAPFALIVLWMGFNLYRLGLFTMTPFAGMNVVGVAMLVGHAEVEPGDGADMAVLIRGINHRKQPPPGEVLELGRVDTGQLSRIFNYNVHEVAETIAERHGWDRVRYDRMLLTYAGRAIRGHRAAYRAYVLNGLGRLTVLVPWLVPALLLPVVWLRGPRHHGFAVAVLLMLVLHVVHVALCAAVEVVIDRYFDLTWAPLRAAALIAAGVAVRDLLLRAGRGRAEHGLEAGAAAGAGVRVPRA